MRTRRIINELQLTVSERNLAGFQLHAGRVVDLCRVGLDDGNSIALSRRGLRSMYVVEMNPVDRRSVHIDTRDLRRILDDTFAPQDSLINMEVRALNFGLELIQRDLHDLVACQDTR